ncbi:PRAME family member 12-like [Myotis daubentonii]|uniref:PRAME family member 12-like n=1 Tax=Myotis daubentonii TaxID=98922 RepID=UPI0028739A8B|nr:PRAME family member 12-like [Myotis daubentonii]
MTLLHLNFGESLRSEPQPTRSQQTFLQDASLSTLTISIRTPPTLLELAGRSLLRDQASAIAALEYLPAELFPPLFIQAYHRRMRTPLKALVHAWPFTVLPLGSLLRLPPFMVLQAVFEGLDVLLAQEIRPRRWKLRVLDLRNMNVNLWRLWSGDSTQKCSQTGPATVHSSSPNMEHPLAPLEVFLDLNFNERDRDKFFMYIIQWAQQRKGLAHLCCKSLRFFDVPFERARKVLDAVQLDCIQEVEVDYTWDLPTLGTFALYLGQMSHLQSLALCHIKMLRLWHLKKLYLESPSFLQGRLDQILRCLQTPLDKLSKLLRHTAWLRSLELQLYPVPLECYRTQETVDQERFALIRAELTETLRELGQPRTIRLDTKYFSSITTFRNTTAILNL